MHLASDYIHPYKDAGGNPARSRVQIHPPYDARDVPVVICSELPNNSGSSITNSAETIAAGVTRADELPTPLVWIEHWPEGEHGRWGEDVRSGSALSARSLRRRTTCEYQERFGR